ncbi:MAG: hypothetical protein ACI9B9_000150 [Halioglobus sp.]
MNQVQLDKIAERIETSFGSTLPMMGQQLNESDDDAFRRVLTDPTYQTYLQDQVNRQIIRDYLVNAVMFGYISDERFLELSQLASTSQGRSTLSLHMLMSSVEAANDLLPQVIKESLKSMQPIASSPPHMVLVKS